MGNVFKRFCFCAAADCWCSSATQLKLVKVNASAKRQHTHFVIRQTAGSCEAWSGKIIVEEMCSINRWNVMAGWQLENEVLTIGLRNVV